MTPSRIEIGSGGYRLGKQLELVVPLVLSQCSPAQQSSDPEMIESCLQAPYAMRGVAEGSLSKGKCPNHGVRHEEKAAPAACSFV